MVGQSHDYKRNGTTTLFAALDGTGEVTGQHHKRRRRVEFLAFMNRLVAQRGQGNPCDPGQPLDTQAEAGHVAEATSQHTLPLYPDTRLMVMLALSSGPRAWSIRNASNRVSRSRDSGY
jgi:hypothetical protein